MATLTKTVQHNTIEATTGFEVTPRLVGQQVELDVAPWSDRFNNQGQIETQGANTTIRVNLGEWVDLGVWRKAGKAAATHLLAITAKPHKTTYIF